ncbi:helix-turn-helix domain-containing protein [Gammaproteobacteria bacterium LSUCC0057]|uniref:Helix-turn-helix domain-containing protein n=1 Tax=Gammaproteobacteria bacterium LSUCC0057 TaxID=2559237 RepID=A0A4Y8UGV9_9GAMM|nr:helix-turn-helix domain-containing protein [Gammaproteobacteria bacterium LSUCC0057]
MIFDSQQQPLPRRRIVMRKEHLAEQIAALFTEFEVTCRDWQQDGEVLITSLGDLELLRTRFPQGEVLVHRTQRLIDHSQRHFYYVCCLISGYADLDYQGAQTVLQANDIALLDSAQEYAMASSRVFDAIWIATPRHRLEGRIANLARIVGARIVGQSGSGRLASVFIQELEQQAPALSEESGMRLANALLDLIAGAAPITAERALSRSDQLLRRIHDYIEERLTDCALSPQTVAAAHAISVRYLNRLFAREQTSTAKWILARRLERSRRQLEQAEFDHQTIGTIAMNNGFNDISTFNRAFKARYALTPRSLRNKRHD